MSLAPLLDASAAVRLHAFAAMAAFLLGVVQLSAPKGTLRHRTTGWIWVGLMVAVALSSFWIHGLKVWGIWSPIHLLSIYTLGVLPAAVWGCPSPRGQAPSTGHDRTLFRGADRGRRIYIVTRAGHARGGVRQLKRSLGESRNHRFEPAVSWEPKGAFRRPCVPHRA